MQKKIFIVNTSINNVMIRLSCLIIISTLFIACGRGPSKHPQDSTDIQGKIVNEPANSTLLPNTRQLNYQKMEVTAFVHWGINTYRGVGWTTDHSGHLLVIDPPSYSTENPFSTDPWVKVAQSFGSKLIIFTAKHHDGFCNYETTNKPSYHIMHESRRYRVDVLKQLRASCNKYDMKLGIYFSPWDASHASWGNKWKKSGLYTGKHAGQSFAAPVGFENAFVKGVKAVVGKSVHKAVPNLPLYNDYLINSVKELINNYQPVAHLWLDGANGDPFRQQDYDYKRLYSEVKNSPNGENITIFGGNQYGDTKWPGNEAGYLSTETWSTYNTNERELFRGKKKSLRLFKTFPTGKKWLVWEVDTTSYNPKKWFYHQKNKFDTLEGLLNKYYNSVGRNGVLLLNIAPGKDGEVPAALQKLLKQFGKAYQTTFKPSNNKVLHSKVKASSERIGRRADVMVDFSAQNAVDGDFDTYWTVDDDKTQNASLEVNLKKPTIIDTCSLQEYIPKGQRISSVKLEAYTKGNWIEIKDYDSFLESYVPIKTIGYKRLVRFSPIKTAKVRLMILSTHKNQPPLISEIGLYRSSSLEKRKPYPKLSQ